MEYNDFCALFTKTGISDAMADQKITTIYNGTGVNATLNSVYYPGDNCNLPNRQVTHTGGSDGDYIRVPDCSGSQWYATHHILLQAVDQSWTFSFWSNDQQNGLLFWNSSDAYSDYYPIANSDSASNGSLAITKDPAGALTVVWSPF
ncbi:hypothetical protein AVMA1855_25085 [Acidovorax sp. SUPP1855]|uniref:hypothetical protein n=1 Tax=Acidovorax sp. SUPP1855 TaxID=431774 RepID=UPI0023DE4BB1|nr:hypothetical protein [Acidovorax sp. SUPP1855]GKS87491.1 hypothetical protein AVMA1855_25085 [Acidovorax sp. SUPP1855]